MTQPKYHQCRKCKRDAVACMRPDPDIKGLCFCEKHRYEVMMEYWDIIHKANEKN